MKKIVFVAIVQFIFTCAICQKTIEGCVTVSVRMYDSLKGYFSPALYFNNKILIYKNYAIREFNTHFYEEDSLGKVVKNKLILTSYIFIDIKKKRFFEYPPLFSPKAVFSNTFIDNDSVPKSYAGYLFWTPNDTTRQIRIPQTTYQQISDTIINTIKFKREHCFYTKNVQGVLYPAEWILYYRYDIKNSSLHFDFNFDETKDNPLVMFEVISAEQRQIREINYERLKLTRKERQVFKAWIRNAKKQQSLESEYVQ
jgi:hypothetical protein